MTNSGTLGENWTECLGTGTADRKVTFWRFFNGGNGVATVGAGIKTGAVVTQIGQAEVLPGGGLDVLSDGQECPLGAAETAVGKAIGSGVVFRIGTA